MNIGVVGNGMIAETFLQDVRSVENAAVVALCVRPGSFEKGNSLAKQYQVPQVYTDYIEFLKQPEIHTVYLGISNAAHYAYAKQALLAGKHVICEKPFTVSAKEARELILLAKEKQLFLWEAFMIPYSPVYPAIKEALPKIGRPKIINCNFSQYSSRYDRYLKGEVLPAFDPAQSGGALNDLNIYNLHFVTGLFGRPVDACYFPNIGFNGIDTSGTVILKYDGFLAVCTAAKDSASDSYCVIQGEKGTIRSDSAASILREAFFISKDQKYTLGYRPERGSLVDEITAFTQQFDTNNFTACYEMLEHTLLVTELVDLLHSQMH